MVTINPDKPIMDIANGNQAERRPGRQKSEFDAIFRQAVDSPAGKDTHTQSTGIRSDIRPSHFSTESFPSTNMVVDQVHRLIDTMEVYQQQLLDRGATLKDIQALVQKMESQSDSITATSSAVGDQDRLKTIVNQCLALTTIEITKFNSGHYNDG